MSRSKKSSVELPAGMHDVLPVDQKFCRFIVKKAESLFEDYSFERIDTSVVDSTLNILNAVGSAADIVQKELFTIKTKDGENLSLRYDNALSAVRTYISQGLSTLSHPIKLFFTGFVFRNTLMSNVYRSHQQLGVETIGDSSEVIDAELLFLAHKVLESIGFHNYHVHINTMGDANCRPIYARALKDFYKSRLKKVCGKCREDFKVNIFRLLECVEESCQETRKEAPQIMDFLDEGCKNHFKRILEFLDSAEIPYILSPYLVRSVDYATRTVFEFWPEEGTTNAGPLVQGGRHDRLVELTGGSKTAAAGWTLNMTQMIEELKAKSANVPDVGIKPKVFLVQLGDAAKRKILLLFEDIRKAGIEIKYSLSRDSLKSQLRIAGRLGVRFTLLFGQKEAIEHTVILREMETGIQETIPLEKIIEELKKRLKK